MKIMIVPSWYPTKENPINGIFFKEQALSLKKHGHEVVVLYPEVQTIRDVHLSQSKKRRGLQWGIEDGLTTFRYTLLNLIPGRIPYSTALFFYHSFKKLYKEAVNKVGKPDIIHAHSCLWGGWAAAKMVKEEGIPLVVTEHSSKFIRGLLRPYEKEEIKKTLQLAAKVISVGPSLKLELQKYTNQSIKVIPNIVNIDDFMLIESDSKKSRRFRFLSVAFLNHNKGMDILIKAFSKAFKGKEADLYIGGEGVEKQNLIQLVKDLGMEGQVQFLGMMDRTQVVKEMQQCDVFVLASRFETFGVVFIEALASGKPIIATKCGGPESIVNEDNGRLVPVENVEALSDAMEAMKENYTSYNQEQIRKQCIERFSEQAIIEQLTNIYLSTE